MQTNSNLTVEAPELELGDIIINGGGSSWAHRQTVVAIKVVDASHLTLTIESKENGRHRIGVSRWAEYDIIRG